MRFSTFRWRVASTLALGAVLHLLPAGSFAQNTRRTVRAEVVALDQCYMNNRLGTATPQGMVFALKRDVVSTDPATKDLKPGQVTLRPGKRPRPIVLRMNVGDILEVSFTNLLAKTPPNVPGTVSTRDAGVHVMGMQLVTSIAQDASWVGENANSLAAPGDQRTYQFFARREGSFLLYSTAADVGANSGASDVGQLAAGLFGAVTVQPDGAEWYRSQVTRSELLAAAKKDALGHPAFTPDGHPVIDYGAKFPDGTPILRMLDANNNLVYSDLTAIITGPDHGNFPAKVPPGPSFAPNPVFPPLPPPATNNGRLEPFREIVIHYHDALIAQQAFPQFFDGSPLANTLGQGQDMFAINYGISGIAAEILANRLGVGPMNNSVESKFEEFFLSSWVVGDPAMVVDRPANSAAVPAAAVAPDCPDSPPAGPDCPTGPPTAPPQPGPKATMAFFPDDPSNVYHSYLHDHVTFRILHAGGNLTHVHHQHAHQWLRTPNSDDSTLLDSQMITPGDAYTLEMIYGSGNRNLTPGDSIFHCHFYPHFAEGMWSLWRVHDVFEEGTRLDDNGRPVTLVDALDRVVYSKIVNGQTVYFVCVNKGNKKVAEPPSGQVRSAANRALPDGEITAGTPIPALVPIPTLPMAPVPAKLRLVAATGPPGAAKGGQRVEVLEVDKNPGYPFFVPGVAGHRAPHPPLDFAVDDTKAPPETLDGGLPRHIVLGPGLPTGWPSPLDSPPGDPVLYQRTNQWDFSKDNLKLIAMQLPENGTPIEHVAIQYHAQGKHDTYLPDGTFVPGGFLTNGQGPAPGAPYANPSSGPARRYKAADIQLDVVLNKKGWHFPQQRMLSLWGDVQPTLAGQKAPEPLFIRANSGEIVEYWLANLIPGYYELDDFQIRTPTDVIGQHIHLVKFDVLASDGAANGFNYEDGTFSPDTVRERIDAIMAVGGLWPFDSTWSFSDASIKQRRISAKAISEFGSGPDGAWMGAQATVQRWWADPLTNMAGKDRTLQTVFTHDHFSPSTHQQAGLYAGLLIEPPSDPQKWGATTWTNPATGVVMPDPARSDGGPTSWEAIISYSDPSTKKPASFREFALEFQDLQLAYQLPQAPLPARLPTPYPRGYTTLPAQPWGWSDSTDAISPAAGPALISPSDQGTRSVNYRNEPIPLRVAGADPTTTEGDLSHAYLSISRSDPQLTGQPKGNIVGTSDYFYPGGFPGAGDNDPYTPLMRAYENDTVKVRVLAGAHLWPHSFGIHGVKWLAEPFYANSGYRGTQPVGLSEHFEMDFTVPTTYAPSSTSLSAVDYFYSPSTSMYSQLSGVWGILRSFKGPIAGLATLPANKAGQSPAGTAAKIKAFLAAQPVRDYEVTAVSASQAIPGGNLRYNTRATLQDPNALLYVLSADLNAAGQLASNQVEPLVLRAKAGELIRVKLTNGFTDTTSGAFSQGTPFGLAANSPLGNIHGATSTYVGLHPQLLSYDVTHSNGFNVGINPDQTVPPPTKDANGKFKFSSTTYEWYAGNLNIDDQGNVTGEPVEFGAINLLPSDGLLQTGSGLYAALVIEPQNTAKWDPDLGTQAQATITLSDGSSFREFVMFVQELAGTSTSNLGFAALNYRSEPWPNRIAAPGNNYNQVVTSDAVSNSITAFADPQTPVFLAPAGAPTRFRLVHPGPYSWNLNSNPPNLTIHGHVWARQPFEARSTKLGSNPLSEWTGSTGSFLESMQLDILLDQAGGTFQVPGDYLYRSFVGEDFGNGMWGIFRVVDPKKDIILIRESTFTNGTLTVRGVAQPPFEGAGKPPTDVKLLLDDKVVATAPVDPNTRTWSLVAINPSWPPKTLRVESANGSTQIAASARLAAGQAIEVDVANAVRAVPGQREFEARLYKNTIRFSPAVEKQRKK